MKNRTVAIQNEIPLLHNFEERQRIYEINYDTRIRRISFYSGHSNLLKSIIKKIKGVY